MKYFEVEEFDSPDKPGSGSNMQASTLLKIDEAREIAGIPFVVNSGYRTEPHNRKVGGVDSSSHTTGHAVDIRAQGGQQRLTIVKAALEAGFTRIGVSRTFIHMDDDSSKPQGVLWTY